MSIIKLLSKVLNFLLALGFLYGGLYQQTEKMPVLPSLNCALNIYNQIQNYNFSNFKLELKIIFVFVKMAIFKSSYFNFLD